MDVIRAIQRAGERYVFPTGLEYNAPACKHSRSPRTADSIGSSSATIFRCPSCARRATCACACTRPRSTISICSSSAGLPGVTIVPPWILGADACGVVDAVGSRRVEQSRRRLRRDQSGDQRRDVRVLPRGRAAALPEVRLLGEHRPGTIADYVVVPAANVRAIPSERAASSMAAAFTLATLTAWRMVVSRARVQAGESRADLGNRRRRRAGGAADLQSASARASGSSRAATTSCARAAELGADELLNRTTVDVARDRSATHRASAAWTSWSTTSARATWAQSLAALGRAWPAGDLRRHVRPDGRDRRAADVLESVVDPRIDDGERRRVRRHRRTSFARDACRRWSTACLRWPMAGRRSSDCERDEQFGKVVVTL